MTDHDDDRRLDDYLAGGSRLSAVYRDLGSPEPPARLDRAVLAAARPVDGARGWRRWTASFTAAAAVGLSLTLGLRMLTEHGAPWQPQTGQPGAQRPDRDADSAERSTAPRLPAGGVPPESSAAQRLQQRAPASDASGLPNAPQIAPPPKYSVEQRALPHSGSAEQIDREIRARGQQSLQEAAQPPPQDPALPSPEAWLAEIRALQEAGRQREAEQQLERFLLAYPNYPRDRLVDF